MLVTPIGQGLLPATMGNTIGFAFDHYRRYITLNMHASGLLNVPRYKHACTMCFTISVKLNTAMIGQCLMGCALLTGVACQLKGAVLEQIRLKKAREVGKVCIPTASRM